MREDVANATLCSAMARCEAREISGSGKLTTGYTCKEGTRPRRTEPRVGWRKHIHSTRYRPTQGKTWPYNGNQWMPKSQRHWQNAEVSKAGTVPLQPEVSAGQHEERLQFPRQQVWLKSSPGRLCGPVPQHDAPAPSSSSTALLCFTGGLKPLRFP